MKWFRISRSSLVALGIAALLLTPIIACGTAQEAEPQQPAAAQQQAPAQQAAAPQQQAAQQQAPAQPAATQPAAASAASSQAAQSGSGQSAPAQAAPTAAPQQAAPSDTTGQAVEPTGTLNTGLKEMGPFFLHPSTLGNPQIFVHGTAPIGEGLLQEDVNRNVLGLLAESWEISDDFLTWTFKLNQGVQFHKGYGEMTAEDVVWSMQQWGLSKHPRAGQLENFWAPRPGSEIIDDHTFTVHTGEPLVHVIAQRWLMTPGGASTFIASKKQTDELGVEGASEQMAATGPWEIVDHRTGEFWKMAAVRDHWRHTPEFAEFIMWEIPEESSRVAGFQTGNLDTFLMGYDSIPSVLDVEGAQLMKVPNAIVQSLRIYGNWYPVPGVEARAGYDPENPWVSPTDDITSPEWDRARKVRLALMTAIDRQALVDEILSGNGNTSTPIHSYSGFEHYLDGRDWEYDPDRAMQLLEEAGYPDGFSITLTPALRGAPQEVESCEAIAQMWENIGLDVDFQRIPYGTLRPTLVGRTYQGATCHAGGPLPTPANGFGSYLTENPFNRGLEHAYSDDLMRRAMSEVDPDAREAMERELGQFLFDNALTDLTYYNIDALWPVGPRIEPWTEHVRRSDVRQINGYEYIRHRR
ncbi:MAG: ABC transporter substrate-binding protein [Chloroflexota bacterium]|nr:ABC transporter substrate-binding protein [Chloroflexota bacterium]MDE2685725.1 ABC transporter substrate-binding protein [Chloroflexota bacterium]